MAAQPNKEQFSGGLAKILEEQWQVDVRLKAGGDSDEGSAISVHKVILASRSEVFKKILESDEVKISAEKVETVTLSEMKQGELEAFVEFIYSDGSLLSAKMKQHVGSLYLAADKYVILHLLDLCRSELLSTLSPENALDFLELAQIPDDKILNDAAFGVIKTNISTIASSEKFKVFVKGNPDLAVEIMKASLASPPMDQRYCKRCRTTSLSCFYCGDRL
ncbi:unnamed protein product [Microthlaspi erraticum]|uniref:BTB domain-containing protein n=1 Tax=Microthlaspi erraticum TaxID=1685480 RepID=A0A6D2ILW2_9BRAS|nr:unnamed protein product [Microthlaspi erraticum]